ncbi:MAG: S41 family peptidase, partial [Anaerolineales bacterium]
VFLGALLLLLVVLVGIAWILHTRPRRVHRNHEIPLGEEYTYLAKKLGSPKNSFAFPREELEDDLDELEWLIENRYSYKDLKGVDYKRCLDHIRHGLDEKTRCGDFGYCLNKMMPLFGDGHTKIVGYRLSLEYLSTEFLPFLVGESAGGLVAFKADRSGFVDANFPYLQKLDGLPVETWLEAAGRFAAHGSPQYVRSHAIRNLRYLQCLRNELGLEQAGTVQVELVSLDTASNTRIEMQLASDCPQYGFWPRPEKHAEEPEDFEVESRVLEGNIGYLRFLFMSNEPEFKQELLDTMGEFKATSGLIIDIRGNGGGSRAPLKLLFPYFMSEEDPPRVVNVASYLESTEDREEVFARRFLFPASSSHWSDAEREAIRQFSESFQPEWTPPRGQFSGWHFFVISPQAGPDYYHYEKPVVVLMNSFNFSASDIFLGAFKGWRNVTLMGLPSGGGSGCRIKYRLHHTALGVYLSSMVSFQPDGQLYDGKGVEPDILIMPSPEDFVGESDRVLQEAVDLITSSPAQRSARAGCKSKFLMGASVTGLAFALADSVRNVAAVSQREGIRQRISATCAKNSPAQR